MKMYIETLEGYENIKANTWYVDTDKGVICHRTGRIVEGSYSRSKKYPYKQVTLSDNEGNKVHKRKCRIIATACVEGRTDKRNEVDHINGKHDDDRPENLRWVSRQENIVFKEYREIKQKKKSKRQKKIVKRNLQIEGQMSML